MIWGFAGISISTNLARDLGTRIVAAIFFGREAFTYYNYSWVSILVNIPATLFATGYYEFLLRDSLMKIGKGHAVHEDGEEGLHRHITRVTPLWLIDAVIGLPRTSTICVYANQVARPGLFLRERRMCSLATGAATTRWESESLDMTTQLSKAYRCLPSEVFRRSSKKHRARSSISGSIKVCSTRLWYSTVSFTEVGSTPTRVRRVYPTLLSNNVVYIEEAWTMNIIISCVSQLNQGEKT